MTKPSPLHIRMSNAAAAAGFTIADMAHWFGGCGQSTMRLWLNGTDPSKVRQPQIKENLVLLELAIREKTHFPIPLDVNQFHRKSHILGIKNGIAPRVLKACAAGGRSKVLGRNKQK